VYKAKKILNLAALHIVKQTHLQIICCQSKSESR